MPLVHACSWEGCNILTMGEYCLEHEQLDGKDDSLVLVTARLPGDELAEALLARRGEWEDAGVLSVRAVGDAWAPGTIASAVWDGRRYAEELDAPSGAELPFRREVVRLAPLESGAATIEATRA